MGFLNACNIVCGRIIGMIKKKIKLPNDLIATYNIFYIGTCHVTKNKNIVVDDKLMSRNELFVKNIYVYFYIV